MLKVNPKNEQIKRAYFMYLKEAQRYSQDTIDGVAAALYRFEAGTNFRDFGRFHREAAVAFKRRLADDINERTGRPLSKATINGILKALRAFFLWLAGQPGYRSRLQYADADYFNLSDKDVAAARAEREAAFPTLDQMHRVLAAMPSDTAIDLRNRALIALCCLTGARADALATVRLKHIDLEQKVLINDGRDMRTKASKTFKTRFFPVGGNALEILTHWIGHLRSTLGWTDADPVFPATQMELSKDTRTFAVAGLKRECWSNTTPVRRIFKAAFAAASLPYFNPHSIRKTLVQLGERLCQTPEEFKAWSQNLGHSGVLTTLTSYGEVASHRQIEIVGELGSSERSADAISTQELLEMLQRRISKS